MLTPMALSVAESAAPRIRWRGSATTSGSSGAPRAGARFRRARSSRAWCLRSGCGGTRSRFCSPPYEEHGPIFAIRIFHAIQVFMLGPEANRFILVTDRDKFLWRDGNLGDLIPLIGDGLLTTDGEYHDRARQIDAAGVPPGADRRHARR